MILTEFSKQYINYKNANLLRKRHIIKQQLINFASNDYLGLANHPKVCQAFIQGVKQYGVGSGSSPLISGYKQPHQLLEEKLADFFQYERAIVFNSGYAANLGVMAALCNRHTTILSDKLIHASLLDGILLSRATHFRYPHQNLVRINELLKTTKTLAFIVTEGVFSMEGDISPLHHIAELATQYHANLIVDDAHGVGIIGKHGRGTCEYYNLNNISCLIVPFGKAFGTMGAVVLGNTILTETILQFAKTYRYTTALPPAICLATLASLRIMQTEIWRREKLQELIHFFIQTAKDRGLPLISNDLTPIKPILIGNNKLALQIQALLIKHGFYTACIRPPTVPVHSTRLRISLNCLHTQTDITRLLNLIAGVYETKNSPSF